MNKEPIKVPAPKPFTREPIKPAVRHRDRKKDYQRNPKHPNKESVEDT